MAKEKIVICDDNEGVRESLRLILEDNYQLAFADNGFAAIEQVKNDSVSLVLLDIKMPRLNGIDTLKEILKIKPKTKVLFVTGYQYTDAAKDALKNGALDYIVKPFEPQELKDAVKKALDKK
ncbi:MAG: response regulator [Candidatus Omnitrophota bacterium]